MIAYSTRPITDGTYPKGHGLRTVVKFGERRFVTEAGTMVWGYVDYEEDVPRRELDYFDLVVANPAGCRQADGTECRPVSCPLTPPLDCLGTVERNLRAPRASLRGEP